MKWPLSYPYGKITWYKQPTGNDGEGLYPAGIDINLDQNDHQAWEKESGPAMCATFERKLLQGYFGPLGLHRLTITSN